ncbi:MAG: C1 family peptidase, partial [Bdellovibrionales bacterium]
MKSLYIVVALFFANSALAAVIDVENLNRILKKSKAGWIAKDNAVNSLPVDQAKRMMGLQRESDILSFRVPESRKSLSAPLTVDWRNFNGGNWVSPILDQGNCGSCVAFASIGALETQYKIASGFSGFNIKLSPQHLF